MKKVLFYMYNLAGGGAERTVINIINNLDKDRIKPILVIGSKTNNDYLYLINKNIKIIQLDCKRHRESLWKLAKVIKKEEPDLLFSTLNMNNIVLTGSRLLTFKKIPVIVREANTRSEVGNISLVNKILTYISYNHIASQVISLSNGVKDDLVKNFNVNEKRIQVIYNPVDITNIEEKKKEGITDFEKNKDQKVIIAVGKLGRQKDYPTLLKAMKKVSEKKNVKLLILGKGPDEKELKQTCFDLDISDRVTFLGFKNNPYKYIYQADIFVLSSIWEGFGHVIVESMAVGTPVVVTDCKSGPAEILKEDEYGILVPTKNPEILSSKIIELLDDEKKYNMYKERGFQRANDFNVHKIVNQYETVFLNYTL